MLDGHSHRDFVSYTLLETQENFIHTTVVYLKEKSRKNIASPPDFNCILGYFCVKKSNKNVKKKSYNVVTYWQNNGG